MKVLKLKIISLIIFFCLVTNCYSNNLQKQVFSKLNGPNQILLEKSKTETETVAKTETKTKTNNKSKTSATVAAEAKSKCVDGDDTKFIIGTTQDVKDETLQKCHNTHINSNSELFISETDCYECAFSCTQQFIIFFEADFDTAYFPHKAKIVQLYPDKSILPGQETKIQLSEDYKSKGFEALRHADPNDMLVKSTDDMESFKETWIKEYLKGKEQAEKSFKEDDYSNLHKSAVKNAIKEGVQNSDILNDNAEINDKRKSAQIEKAVDRALRYP